VREFCILSVFQDLVRTEHAIGHLNHDEADVEDAGCFVPAFHRCTPQLLIVSRSVKNAATNGAKAGSFAVGYECESQPEWGPEVLRVRL